MQLSILLLFLFFITSCQGIYDHRPGERYQTLLPNLDSDQQMELKQIIYNQGQTKGQIFENVKHWLHSQPTNTQYQFVRSQIDYKQKDEARNKALNAMETLVSEEAKQFNWHIRKIYDDPSISDRQTCEAVSASISDTSDSIREQLNITPMNCEKVFELLAH